MSADRNSKKKDNIRIYVIFVLLILTSLLGGFFVGRFASENKEELTGIDWKNIWKMIADTLPIVYGILVSVTFIVVFVMYGHIRQLVRAWDGENEAEVDVIERRITVASFIPCLVVFIGFILFPTCIYALDRTYNDGKGEIFFAVSELVFIGSIVLYCMAEKLVIDEEKQLNPEKNGNIFDIHFRRDWEKSSDEAELIMIAKSSKNGFMAGIKTGFIIWIFMFVCMFIFDTGVLPIVAVGAVLLVMYVAYGREFMKLQR